MNDDEVHGTNPPHIRRRSVLSLAVVLGAGAGLGRLATSAAPASAQSLDTAFGASVGLTTVGTEPSAVLRRYRNVFSSIPQVNATFFRTNTGILKIAAGSAGLTDQLQIIDAASGVRELSLVPFPGSGGGVGKTAVEAGTGALLAFGADDIVKRVTVSGTVSDAYQTAPLSSNAAFAVAVDSRDRVWNGNYPTGNTTRYDPRTGTTFHTDRVRPDTQYVRSLAIDDSGRVYAGTGSQNPTVFTWHTDSPEQAREIPLPDARSSGFVHRIDAHGDVLFVYFDGADGMLRFEAYRTSSGTWLTRPWDWMPSAMTSGSAPGTLEAYAVWNTVGVHKLMRIDTRTLEASYVCLVPDTARAIDVEVSDTDTFVNVLCGSDGQYRCVRVSVGSQSVIRDVVPDFAAQTFKLQALMASQSEDKIYFGGYTGDGIGSVGITSRTVWRSPLGSGIAQIEGMFEYDASTIYVGSYTGGVLLRFNPVTQTDTKLIELRYPYYQSRPICWAAAGGRVVAGTIPDYGRNGGALAILNPANDADIKVVSGPVAGQSVLGLVGEGDIVYGTTGIMGGLGSNNDTKPAHVFAWNVAQGRLLWARPFTGEVEINSPIMVNGILYVSTNNGVIRINKTSGSPVATYQLLYRTAAPGFRTSTIKYLPKASSIVHMSGGTVTVLDPFRQTRKEVLRGAYTEMVVNKQGRMFFVEDTTNIVEVDAVQRPTIRTTADLVSVGPNGWLNVCRSLGDGRFGNPIRADSAYGGYVRSSHVVDWNGDGTLDVLTNHSDGTLQLHRGLPNGGFMPPTVVGQSGWAAVDLTVGIWGTSLSVLALDASGTLRAWPVLSSGALGTPATIGTGWQGRNFVLMVPSRSTGTSLIVNQGGSLYRYSRVYGGKVTTTPVRLSTGGFSAMTAFSPVYGHRPDLNGIVWIDANGAVKYTDIAPSSVGSTLSYPFILKSHKFAST
ncbi:FG-GAP-like repeat-containing protein [Arthrobacter celericrescens]|uniref:FG-GAP-like repeat-containing protein n=1 Tax=Arthrobacter celericrescens TaxID=2320851 RepID=UPI000EA2944E|nr:FG-GAP-like repeat-containing protein [Arthrobacter celericrescens]